MSNSLEGRRALVGGASRGIGRGCAEALAAAGASVTLMARDVQLLEQVADTLPASDHQRHDFLAVDFTEWEGVRDAVSAHLASHGPVAILINNTGGPGAGLLSDADPEPLAAAFEQHVLTYHALTRVIQPGMVEMGFGRIINIVSTSVAIPIKRLGVSNTIRGAVANWGRTLASELGPFGITVNNVLPGYIDTSRLRTSLTRRAEMAGVSPDEISEVLAESVPARRFGTPADIGAVVAFLASEGAAYVNGVNLPVDGGRLVSLNT